MDKVSSFLKLQEESIVAVIRADSEKKGLLVAKALKAGGVKFLEVTMTVPGAINVINKLTEYYNGCDVFVGAGTVLDSQTARNCLLAGAKFIVSPHFDKEILKVCNRYCTSVIPGASTVTEVVKCLEYGADVIKLFPGATLMPAVIKDLKGPLPHANFMPTGGIDLTNIANWIKAGAFAVGVGGSMTKEAKNDNYEAVTRCAAQFVSAVKKAKTI